LTGASRDSEGFEWHDDNSGHDQPRPLSMLYCVESPARVRVAQELAASKVKFTGLAKKWADFRPLIGIPVKLLGQLADSGPLPVNFRLEKPEIQVPNCRCISCRISIEFGRRWGCECTPATPTGLPRSSTAGISTRPQGEIHRVDPDFGSTLTASSRDYQSNCWVNWKIMGQPCEFQVLRSAWGEVGRALQSDLARGRTALLRAL
jgi:hypothetical protein